MSERMSPVVVATMQRDEETRLEAWILYHASLFGFGSLHIFDNGSTSTKVKRVLKKYAALGVYVDYGHVGTSSFVKKGEIIAGLFRDLEKDSDIQFFFPMDCDEFLVLRRPDGQLTADRYAIIKYLMELVEEPRVLLAEDAYANVLGHPGYFLPPYAHRRAFFTNGCCTWIHEGFHAGESRKAKGERFTNFAYLHFHYRPYADMVRQSKWKLSHLVDVTNPSDLQAYTGDCFHVARFLLIPERDYVQSFSKANSINVPWLVFLFTKLGVTEKFFRAI